MDDIPVYVDIDQTGSDSQVQLRLKNESDGPVLYSFMLYTTTTSSVLGPIPFNANSPDPVRVDARSEMVLTLSADMFPGRPTISLLVVTSEPAPVVGRQLVIIRHHDNNASFWGILTLCALTAALCLLSAGFAR